MKILNILTDSNIGGAGRLLVHVLRNFDRARFDGWVILPKGSALIPAVRETGFPVLEMEYGADESWDRRSVRELRRMIRDLSPDVVHCHATLSGRVASWLEHVPCRFYTRHSVFPPPKRLTTFPGKQLNGLLNRVISTDIVAVAEAAKKNLTDTGVPEKMITGRSPRRNATPSGTSSASGGRTSSAGSPRASRTTRATRTSSTRQRRSSPRIRTPSSSSSGRAPRRTRSGSRPPTSASPGT